MPRWPNGATSTKKICPACGGNKDFNALACRKCATWSKANLGKKGAAHPAWKGGQRIDRDGYIKTYATDHPWPRRGGYIGEHVRLMELKIGRRIKSNEVVHHINDDNTDNRIENLELKTGSSHSKDHRAKDKHLYKRNPKTGRYARKEVPHAS